MHAGSAENFFAQAQAAMDRGQPDRARESYAEALKKDPKPELADDIHYHLGLSLARGGDLKRARRHVRYFQARTENLIENGKFDAAISVLDRALEIAPDNVRLMWHRGVALYSLGRLDEAATEYEGALALIAASGRQDPQSVSTLTTNIGIILGKQRRFAAAVDRFDAAVMSDPTSDIAENAYGAVLFAQRDFVGAAARYQNALQKAPDDRARFRYKRALGIALLWQRRVTSAVECFRDAERLGPPSADLYYDWGNALCEQRRYGEALERFERATQTDASFWKAHHNIADIAWSQGRYCAARKRWDGARRVYEQLENAQGREHDPQLFFAFGTILAEIYREFRAARKRFERGRDAAQEPHNSLGLAKVYAEQRDTGGAAGKADAGAHAWSELKRAEHLIKGDETWKRDPDVLRLLAEVQILMREYDEAEANLRTAAEGDPDSVEIIADIGLVWMAREDYDRARTFFETAVARSPGKLDIRTNLAQAHLKAKALSSAESEYKQLLTMSGEHIEAWFGLGDVYAAMAEGGDEERYADAVFHYTQGIGLATAQSGKRISESRLAEAYYALGYAHVKVSETSRDLTGKAELYQARNAFRRCRELNPEHYKAQRAIEKIDKHTNIFSSSRWIDALTSGVIVILALFLFTMAQVGLIRGQPLIAGSSAPATAPLGALAEAASGAKTPTATPTKPLVEPARPPNGADAPYVVLSLGSILLAIAGFYLPRVLKLKFGSLELEKSAAEQTTTPTALGIRL